jgi:type II secretory pathway pseudopilin PulG
MIRFKFQSKATLSLVALVACALMSCVIAAAQTDSALTPAQQKAQAARAARQAAAQQAAANRAAAAQARTATAQNKTTPQNKPGANPTTPNTTNPLTNSAGSTTRPGTVPGSATNPNSAQRTTGSGTVGSGTLAWATRVYSSTGCAHNGNSAVCTFTFSNQGNEVTLVAGGEMSGIQLIDDAHVPHHADSAHFLDKYGTQQPRLLVQPGDTGTYILTFPDVNSQVASGDFHLRQQIVGGVTFSGSPSSTTGASASAGAPTKAAPRPVGATPK